MFTALDEISTRASKSPRKENPKKSPKVPPRSATCGLSSIDSATPDFLAGEPCVPQHSPEKKRGRWGAPPRTWHQVRHPGHCCSQNLPRLVGHGPQGEYEQFRFHIWRLLVIGKTELPVKCFPSYFLILAWPSLGVTKLSKFAWKRILMNLKDLNGIIM